jgi:hypothetical protein
MLKIARDKVDDQTFIQMIAEASAPIRKAGHHQWIKNIQSAIEHAT